MSLTSTLLRQVLSVCSAIAPAITGKLFFNLWFKTKRYALGPEEEILVSQAKVKTLVWKPSQTLHVYEWGEGPVALLVHGWNGRAAQFHKVIEFLRIRGYKVVAYDAPGHGLSSGTECDLPAMVAALEMVHAHYGSVDLIVSHSLGGLAAGSMISKGYPVRQLMMIAPPNSIGDVIDITAKALSLSSQAKSALRSLFEEKYGGQVWKDFSFAGFRKSLDCVSKITVIHDDQDKEIPLIQGKSVSRNISNSVFLTTTGLGHKRILKSDEFLKLMETRLAAPESSGVMT